MRMGPTGGVAASLAVPLLVPITVRWFGDAPRLFAGGYPVTPVNLALRDRVEHGQTRASSRSYVYAAELFLSFLASRQLSLIEASDAHFRAFMHDLVSETESKSPRRSATTAQNIVSRLYGLFADIEAAYDVAFDWRRYRAIRGNRHGRTVAREHRFRVPVRAPMSLPDAQFRLLIERASDLWRDRIADGDAAFAAEPGKQQGALFARNLAILMLLRFAGARRSEVAPLDLGDIDRAAGLLQLVTKGRAGGKEPVVLLPAVESALMAYILSRRPYGVRPFRVGSPQRPRAVDPSAVLLSHSAYRYGERISDETVRYLLDRLRPALDQPWRDRLHPHLLRHSFAHELQRIVGPFAASANLRHRTLRSIDPYRADVQQWADSLREIDSTAAALLAGIGSEGSL